MASFDINFIANTTGVHTVYWRNYEDPVNTYPNSDTVNVTAPGLQTITIQVTGNLYCAPNDIAYNGYVIADCMSPTPVTNGIPDTVLASGSTWSIVIEEQVDPCQDTTITCDNVPIESLTLTEPGSYYGGPTGTNAGTPATVTIGAPTAPGGVQATATADHGDGIIATIVIGAGGGGTVYPEADGTQNNIPLIELGQVATDGTLGTVDVTFTSGVVTAVTLNTAGSGYTTNDVIAAGLTIDYTALAVGTPPATEAEFDVTSTNAWGDQITNLILTNGGSGYQAVPTVSFGVTEATQATATIVMEDCPSLLLSDYDCTSNVDVVGTPDYHIPFLGSLDICGDATALAGLGAQWAATDNGNCHCKGCDNVVVDLSGTTTGSGSITYQTCWDGSNGAYGAMIMVTNTLTGGGANVDLGCVLVDTVYIEDITLDATPSLITTECS